MAAGRLRCVSDEAASTAAFFSRELNTDERARDERIALLEEENRWLKAQLFGRSSERRAADEVSPDQAKLLFNEAEAIAHVPEASSAPESLRIPAHERRKPGRKPLPKDLPRIEVVHDLPEAEKRCAEDGTALEVIGEERAEQLDYVPAKLRVIRHIRLKYACSCCRQGVKLAAAPVQLFPTGLEQKTCPALKGLRWVVLKDRGKLNQAQRQELDALLAQMTTRRTARAWLYREQLREILNRKQPNVVCALLQQWSTNVMRSKSHAARTQSST